MKKFIAALLVASIILLPLSGCLGTKKKVFEFKPSKVFAQALYVKTNLDGKSAGGSSKVTVDIKKSKDKKIRVGFFEEEVAGTGDMWRAAGWSAALTTSLLLGINIADYEISYTVAGRIDGPSAGGLMTVATLASILGEKIKPDATMTGTINIDGSIGPVGGIPHKLEGAKEAKKKIVGIPSGQRLSEDENSLIQVDVIDKGKEMGLEVKQVSNIYEAYELLVGKPLVEAKKIDEDNDPELPESSISQVKAKAKEWASRYNETGAKYKALSPTMINQFNGLVGETDKIITSANSHYDQGLFAAAFGEMTQAAIRLDMLYSAAKTGDAALGAALGGQEASLTAASKEIDSLKATGSRLDSLYERLKEKKAQSLGDTLALASSYGAVLEGSGIEKIANSYASRGDSYAQKLENLMMAGFFYAAVPDSVNYAEDFLEISIDEKGAAAPDAGKIAAMGEILRKAAESNLNVFETTVVAQKAKAANMDFDAYKWTLMNKDIYYAFASGLIDSAAIIKEKAGSGLAGDYATLGAAISSYTYSSHLLAKYYMLKAEVDNDGNIISVARDKALIEMLDYNLERTRQNIAIAKKAGGVSPFPIINYEKAKIAREGNVGQKVDSLLDLWQANLQSQIMTMLSGKLELAPSAKTQGKTLEYKWKK